VAREFMAADADTDPRAAPCSTLLRAGPLAMGRPRRSADELGLPVAVCLTQTMSVIISVAATCCGALLGSMALGSPRVPIILQSSITLARVLVV